MTANPEGLHIPGTLQQKVEQERVETKPITPEEIAAAAKKEGQELAQHLVYLEERTGRKWTPAIHKKS